ncbi:MAG: 6-phosphofructokinase, partial [Chloroflexota bacterium]|nr:6-phosphofructokinase [Chloroflexota bacterium]
MADQTTTTIRRLGILTGGGDVPGLNTAIKAAVYRSESLGVQVLGLRLGWEGITYLNRDLGIEGLEFDRDDKRTWEHGYLYPLDRLNTRTIDRLGGTILQSTRTNPAKVKVADLPPHLAHKGEGHAGHERIDLTGEVLKNIDFLGLDGLIAIGGDDTLSYAARLRKEGVPVWGIPKTMDNDV